MKNLLVGKKSRWMKMGGIGIALLLLLAVAATSFAQTDVTGSLDINAGSLTIGVPGGGPAFSAVTLNGTNQTVSAPIDINVQDSLGTGDGWHLEVAATTFTDGTYFFPTDSLSITDVSSTCTGTTCIDPVNVANTYTMNVPLTATEFFEATAGTGLGAFTITPTFELSVPATTLVGAGTYTSTITLTITNVP